MIKIDNSQIRTVRDSPPPLWVRLLLVCSCLAITVFAVAAILNRSIPTIGWKGQIGVGMNWISVAVIGLACWPLFRGGNRQALWMLTLGLISKALSGVIEGRWGGLYDAIYMLFIVIMFSMTDRVDRRARNSG